MSTSKQKQELSPEVSKMYCRLMNEQHLATVMAMAMDTLTFADRNKTVSAATMTKITLYDCHISFAQCMGSTCEMRNTTIPFLPPLESEEEIEPRMEAIHQRVLAPDVMWLFKPFAGLILIVCGSAAIAKFVIGQDAVTNYIEESPLAYERVTSMLGSVATVNYLISFVFWTSFVGHGLEACFVAYQCKTRLELSNKNTLLWFILVSMVGYPIMTRFTHLLRAQMHGESQSKGRRAKKER